MLQCSNEQLDRRMAIMTHLDRQVMSHLHSDLQAINPYAAKYKSAAEAAAGVVKLDLIIRANTGDVDMRRYNAPVANTVAALLPGKPTPDPLDVLPS